MKIDSISTETKSHRLLSLNKQVIISDQWKLASVDLWTGETLTLINPPEGVCLISPAQPQSQQH